MIHDTRLFLLSRADTDTTQHNSKQVHDHYCACYTFRHRWHQLQPPRVVRLSLLTLGLSATSASLNPSNIPANKFTADTTNAVRGARVTEDDLIHCFDDLHLKWLGRLKAQDLTRDMTTQMTCLCSFKSDGGRRNQKINMLWWSHVFFLFGTFSSLNINKSMIQIWFTFWTALFKALGKWLNLTGLAQDKVTRDLLETDSVSVLHWKLTILSTF